MKTGNIISFASALKCLVKGQKVRRLEWPNKNSHLFMVNDIVQIYKIEDNQYHPLIISSGDIINNDWVVCGKNNMH